MTTPADEMRTAATRLRSSSPAVASHTVRVWIPPTTADALAAWLDAAAAAADTIGPDPHATAVARTLIGGEQL